jgi:predicted NUDIX family phosphoesterase
MSKHALVVSVEDFENKPKIEWNTFMMSRDICETDERYLQIIPYVTVVNEKGDYLVYERGSSGQEERLRKKLSIGLGGHIDNPVTATLDELIALEAAREIEEEVGVSVDVAVIKEALRYAYFIRLQGSSVDRVHLGVSIKITMDSSQTFNLEEGVILNPMWMPAAEVSLYLSLKAMIKPEALSWEFEPWSEYVLHKELLDLVKKTAS